MIIKLQGNKLTGAQNLEIEPRVCQIDFPGFMFHAGPFTAFQTAPERRLVHLKDQGGNRVEETFEILTPWIVYLVSVFDDQISNIWMLGSPDRITSLSHRVFRLPVPNLYADGRFCMPRVEQGPPKSTQSLYETTLSIVWESYYNADLFSEFSRYIWDFPFFGYPDDLPDETIHKMTFKDMLSPGDVFKAWEENITEENLDQLFNLDLEISTRYISEEIPSFSARNLIAANHLQYMG